MEQETEIKKAEYRTLDEAYALLSTDVQLHGIRTAEYTRVLFDAALQVEMNLGSPESQGCLKPENQKAFYYAGKYHDLGLALLPDEYQHGYRSMTPEELKLYGSHVEKGLEMLNRITRENTEFSQEEWDIIVDTIQYHHESPNGKGYPLGLTGSQMPMAAWIIACADGLDYRAANYRLENPFEVAFAEMMEMLDNEEAEELHLVLEASKAKLRKVFRSHADETRMVQVPEPMIKRRNNRPMGLQYRPVLDFQKEEVVHLMAEPYFMNRKEKNPFSEIYEEVHSRKEELTLWKYFLYEVADMLGRMKAYGFTSISICMPILQNAANQTKAITAVRLWIKETGAAVHRLILTIPEEKLAKPGKAFSENLRKMREEGLEIALTDYQGEIADLETMKSFGIQRVFLAPSILDHLDQQKKETLQKLIQAGITITADGIENEDYQEDFLAMGITRISGPQVGEYISEDDTMIKLGTFDR